MFRSIVVWLVLGSIALAGDREDAQKLEASRKFTGALALYVKACDAKNAAACGRAGKLYLDGRGTRVDHAKALELFGKACEAGDAAGCYEHAQALELRDLPKLKNRDELASKSMHRACDLGFSVACLSLADEIAHRDDKRSKAQLQALRDKARDAAKAGCAKDDADECANLVQLTRDDKAAMQRAIDAERKACDAGRSFACEIAYALLTVAKPGSPELAKAEAKMVEVYKLDCAANDARACWAASDHVSEADRVRSRKKACTLGFTPAC